MIPIKEQIEKVKIANKSASEASHAGHRISVKRWDCGTVKVCEKCVITVEPPVLKHREDIDIPTHRHNKQPVYKVL
jgi:hypothetical protein